MIEEIINGIKYLLNEEILTAEVIQLKEDFKSDEDNFVEQFLQEDNDGYKCDIIIPETVVFNERTYCVTSIGDWAFFGCISLTSITYQGTIAQ